MGARGLGGLRPGLLARPLPAGPTQPSGHSPRPSLPSERPGQLGQNKTRKTPNAHTRLILTHENWLTKGPELKRPSAGSSPTNAEELHGWGQLPVRCPGPRQQNRRPARSVSEQINVLMSLSCWSLLQAKLLLIKALEPQRTLLGGAGGQVLHLPSRCPRLGWREHGAPAPDS